MDVKHYHGSKSQNYKKVHSAECYSPLSPLPNSILPSFLSPLFPPIHSPPVGKQGHQFLICPIGFSCIYFCACTHTHIHIRQRFLKQDVESTNHKGKKNCTILKSRMSAIIKRQHLKTREIKAQDQEKIFTIRLSNKDSYSHIQNYLEHS